MSLFKNYNASDVYVYPSANRNDGGESNSEKNLRSITDKFSIKSFVVRRSPSPDPEYLGVSISKETDAGQVIKINRGECSIGGYYIVLKDTAVSLSSLSVSPLKKYNIAIVCVLDAVGLLSGDGVGVVGEESGVIVSRGVRFQLITDEDLSQLDSRYKYLLLGEVSTDSNGKLIDDSLTMRDDRYSFIDIKTILSTTGEDLEIWINNKFSYELGHLNQLSFFDNPEDEDPSCTFVIKKVSEGQGAPYYDAIFYSKEGDQISLKDIDNRTKVSDKGKYLSTGNSVSLSNNSANTFNGNSDKLAREDHRHDDRYVHKVQSNSEQVVSSPIKFSKVVKTAAGITGTGFSVNDDGSARFGSGKFTVDSQGNVKSGNITSTGDVTATRVFNAVWNDYAEFYLKDTPRQEIVPGTVISKVPGKFTYSPSNKYSKKLVVGVCSDTYGHILGGEVIDDIESNLGKYIPVALSGRVKVLVVHGVKIREGDLLVASDVEGRATVCEDYLCSSVIGKSLEDSDGTKDKVLIQVFLR